MLRIASRGSVSDVASTLRVSALLLAAAGMVTRDLEASLSVSRTAAKTVWFGRERNFSTKPRPIPRLAPVTRTTVVPAVIVENTISQV